MIATSGHLPECEWNDDTRVNRHCICDRLRACEQRSYALGIEVGKHDGWVAGHAAGVQAAREAVWRSIGPGADTFFISVFDRAIAAIDALRGER